MCKKKKRVLDEFAKSANRHFNSADWHKFQNMPRFVFFNLKLIRPNFQDSLAYFSSNYHLYKWRRSFKIQHSSSLNVKEPLEVFLQDFLLC